MRRFTKALVAALSAAALAGTVPHYPQPRAGTFRLDLSRGPYFSGSRIPIAATGVSGRYRLSALGAGAVDGNVFVAPDVSQVQRATLVASADGALAVADTQIVPPPAANRPLIAVATYKNGIALHDAQTFALLGYVGIAGPPGDVTFAANGSVLAPDTDGDSLTSVSRSPWQFARFENVPEGNEVLADPRSGAIFVSDRDFDNGQGALTRIAPDGSVTHVVTGDTAEGLAIDDARGLIYVGNVNDNSVAVVDMRSMRVVQRIASVPRTFGIALDARRRRLFVVSNVSPSMREKGGYAAAIDVGSASPRIVARSARMNFPLGAAFDAQSGRLFVTDEGSNLVYVLNGETMRNERAPLRTCDTPWRPRIAGNRLYVPCAQADKVDVFDLATLRRVHGAPFDTGGFPLGVAEWH